MPSNLDRYRADLDALVERGGKMLSDLILRQVKDNTTLSPEQKKQAKELVGTFERDYQAWYTEASAVLRQILPDRSSEFDQLYRGDGKRKTVDMSTYTIQDWLNGLRASTDYAGQKRFQDESIVFMRFSTQLDILRSANRRFESSLLDIRQLVQADLMDSELETARELLKRGFHRAAGAMAGVVLEKHLQQVVSNHAVTIRKKSPGIADLNEVLKGAGVLDVPTWRFVQRLGDLRNICSHGKDREPTSGEVEELVAGVEKITKTVF